MIDNRFAFGVVGGLGALAGADFLQPDPLAGDAGDAAGTTVALLDPTMLPAAACVRQAQAASHAPTIRN